MPDLGRLMQNAAAKPQRGPDVEAAFRRGRRARVMRYGLLSASAAVTAVAVVLAATTWVSDDDRRISPAPEASTEGRIVFARWTETGSSINVMDADGSNLDEVAPGAHYAVNDPAWSPDGRSIAFHGFYGEATDKDGGLFVMGADGSDRTLVIRGGDYPSWSPDMRDVTYHDDGTIYVVNRETGDTRPIILDAREAEWAPDGSRIVFVRENGNMYVMRRDSDPGTELPVRMIDDRPARPDWSPEGTQIAFTKYTGDGPGSVMIINADGTGLRELVRGESPAWSPDGARIAFERTSDDGQSSHIYSIKIDGTDERQLTFGDVADHSPDWGFPSQGEPDCPTIGEGGYRFKVQPSPAAPGQTATITGAIPMHGEGGQYISPGPDDAVHFWVDVDPENWQNLIDSQGSPNAYFRANANPTEGTYLGSVDLSDPTQCTYRFDFNVPNLEPGDHNIVGMQFGGDGAAPLTEGDRLIIVDEKAAPPCEDEHSKSYGQEPPGRWLKGVLLELGAPGGYPLTEKDVRDTGTAFWIDIPEYDNDPTIYATMLTKGDDPNISQTSPREKIGEEGDYTLYLQQGDPWEAYSAVGPRWKISLLAYPGRGNDQVAWPDGVIDWLRDAAGIAQDDPPLCSGPIT